MPAKIALGRLGLGDARLPYAAIERLQSVARMIALVGDQHAGLVLARREADLAEIARSDFEGRRKRRRVAFVGRMDRRRHHDAGVEIDRVLGLVGQMRRPILHPGDLRLGVGRALPVRVRQRLALALAVEARQILGAGRVDPALFRHPRQHLAIALAVVAPHDRAQRRVGLHRRAVDPDPLALHQTALGDQLQDPAEHLLVRLVRKTRARARQPRMIGDLVPVRQPQEIAQRERVRAPPCDAALAVDPLEIADHVHAEIPSRRQRRRAHPRRIIRLADLLHERVETGFPQQRLQPVVERVSRRARHLPPTSPSSRPDPPPTAPSPSPITLPKRRNRRESELPDFVNGLLGAVAPICGPLLRPLRVAAIAAGLGLAPCAAVAQEFVELPQSIVPFGPGVTVVGPASPDAPVHFQLALKLRNFSELQDRLAAGQQVAYPELEQQFLPTAQDYGSVVAWLRGEGLTIERTARDRMTVAAGGAVASVSRALGISFMHIISEGQEYVSANSAPKAPAALSGIVASVNGLQPQLHMNKLSILSPQATPGFSPAGIRDAYAATGLSETGANTTTAIIIDTFPNRSDLTTFWNEGLVPQLQSNITFIQAVPGTLPAPSGEESIDTEWASSIAPGSKVRVYAYGNTATNAAFFTDVDNGYEAIILDLANGVKITQVSISLGICETLVPQGQFLTDEYFHAILTSLGATVLVATGDNGSTGCFRFTKSLAKVAEFPSTSPDVTAVGGTTLVLNSNGSVASETAWSGDGASGGSGGGLSVAFKTPSYQSSLGLPSRGVPDVAADANPATGVAIVLNGKVVVFGGTSVATPIWAGLMGLVNQARLAAGKSTLGLLNQRLYRPVQEAAFRDITVGNNGF